jgi:hypothetical protein
MIAIGGIGGGGLVGVVVELGKSLGLFRLGIPAGVRRLATCLLKLLPMSSTTFLIAAGVRVALGDVAKVQANAVIKAAAISPVLTTIALASDTLDVSKMACVIASSSTHSCSASYSSVAFANVVPVMPGPPQP